MTKSRFFTSEKESRHFLLIGGFLGAGKTTLIGLMTRLFEEAGKKVALITNDQGEGLLDTASARSANSTPDQVAEITGGCFCCRLDELVESMEQLDGSSRPDVMIAEPVGSCTDLMATVLQPLEKIYRTPMTLAPLSVVLDARRALAALGGKKQRGSFHRDVGYVYRKQLEEAEWLVVNKVDLLEESDLADLKERLAREFPGRRQFYLSAKTGEGVAEGVAELLRYQSSPAGAMEIDYERYAVGEALLGWVNLEGRVSGLTEPGRWLHALASEIAGSLEKGNHEVGHFKMSLASGKQRWRVHLVMEGDEVELVEEGEASPDWPAGWQLLVNLRAEGDAGTLQGFVHQALRAQAEATVVFSHEAAFQPGKPEPTHRIA